jgi:DNA-binding response OmpR family regulator
MAFRGTLAVGENSSEVGGGHAYDQEVPSMSETTPAQTAAQQILIVPHCWECATSLQVLLSLRGHPCEVVRGGDAAVRRALEVSPQVVMLDANLTGEDSLEVGRRLRLALGRRMRLIALAPYSWEGKRERWAEAGFDAFLEKPVDPGVLRDLLDKR